MSRGSPRNPPPIEATRTRVSAASTAFAICSVPLGRLTLATTTPSSAVFHCSGRRKLDHHRGAGIGGVAEGGGPPHGVGQTPRNRQAESEPRGVRRSVQPCVGLEEPFAFVVWHAGPSVRHRDLHG